MRSSPASASVICVPIPTTWNIGATRNARNAVNVMKPPSVMRAARGSARAPTYITIAPTTPISTVAERLIRDMAVRERFMTLSSRRCTPPANTFCFPLLRVIALHHAHAAQRFGEAPGDFGVDLAALAEDGPDAC